MSGSSLFANLARGAKVIALLLFLLPWVAVSCSPDAMEQMQSGLTENAPATPRPSLGGGPIIKIATASGLQMATGSISMADPTGGMAPPGATEGASAERAPEIAPEIGVIAGAALLVLGLLLTFVLKGAAGLIAGAGASLFAAAAFCYSVFVHYPPAALAAFAAGREGSNATPEQVAQVLSVKPEIGFWLVLVLLLVAAVFNVLAMRKPGAPAQTGSPPPAG